jgi:glutaminyl-peptide cyclotransferase
MICGAACLLARRTDQHPRAPISGYRVVGEYPHDRSAFTQGLIYVHGNLFESTGLQGRSSLRRVDLETGRILQEIKIPDQYFAEGLTDWQGRLIQLTWVSHVGFVYDAATFEMERDFHYKGEGWGLTHDRTSLILSDGSDSLRFLDPETFQTVRTLRVTDGPEPVNMLNELENVNGEIYANVWQTDRVACISSETGRVKRWIDFTGLLKDSERDEHVDVLNGIAYDSAHDLLLVTGKLWPKLFAVKIDHH